MNKELEFLEENYGHNSWNNYPPSKQQVAQWLKEYTEKQFAIFGVVKSLPSKEELSIELSNKLIDIFDADETWEKEHYKYGFNACFAFIKEYLTK